MTELRPAGTGNRTGFSGRTGIEHVVYEQGASWFGRRAVTYRPSHECLREKHDELKLNSSLGRVNELARKELTN